MVDGILNPYSIQTGTLNEEPLSGNTNGGTGNSSDGSVGHLPVVNGDIETSKQVSSAEDKIRNNRFEKAIVFDQYGNIIAEREGTEKRVSLAGIPDEDLKDSIVTHNHSEGTSFSIKDITTAVARDLMEIRAVTL